MRPVLDVDEEHAARLQAAFAANVFRRYRQHTGLRGHDDQIILGHRIARGTQTVAVEHCADACAVGKGDGRRTVPGLHQAGVVLVESLLRITHGLMVLPGFRDHHHDGMRQGAAAVVEQFEGVVEDGRIAGAGSGHGKQLGHVVAEEVRFEEGLAGIHPVDVAAQRVDFAVVAQKAKGMGQVPGRKGVGAVALVDQRQGADHVRVAQVGKIGLDLIGEEHALVNQGAAGQAGDVKEGRLAQTRLAHEPFHDFADDEQFALEMVRVGDARSAADEKLLNRRFPLPRQQAQGRAVDRHAPPSQELLTLLLDDLFKSVHVQPPLIVVARHEHQAAAVTLFRR